MAKAKFNYKQITTPRGVLIYPHLTEADTKFVKPDGEYHTKFALEADSAEANGLISVLNAELDRFIEENPDGLTPAKLKKAGRNDFYEEEVDEEGEETGRLIFKFKLKAKVKTKTKEWDQKPRLFDSGDPAKGIKPQPLGADVNPWTGSEAKISAEVFPYYMETSKVFGLSLRCQAVQILKLVSGQGKTADAFGFDGEEDGYVSDSTGAGFEPEASDEDDTEF